MFVRTNSNEASNRGKKTTMFTCRSKQNHEERDSTLQDKNILLATVPDYGGMYFCLFIDDVQCTKQQQVENNVDCDSEKVEDDDK